MEHSGKIAVSRPSANEVRVARAFEAPRDLVFEAFAKPKHVKRWLFGPDEWPMAECVIDFRVGGTYRYVWRHKEKGDMGLSGAFLEIESPTRIVHTELFDDDWTAGEAVVTTVFEERGARTLVTATVRYSAKAVIENILKTGMLDGWARAYDRLEALLAGG